MTTPVSAMLISLSFTFGKQGGEDKALTQELCDRHGSSNKAVKGTKLVICKEAFAPLKKLTGEWKDRLRRVTAAWDIPGVYLCKPVNVPKAIALRDEYTPLLNVQKASHLIERLDEWKELTKAQTKGAFKEAEFPEKKALIRDVTWTMGVMPLPESEALRRIKDIDDTLMEELTKSHNARVQSGIREGMASAYTKLISPLQNMVKVLGTDKPKIFESLVENVRGIVAEIPGLNLTDDPQLAAFAKEAENLLSSLDADTLRDSPVIRQETAQKAADILATFGATGLRRFTLN